MYLLISQNINIPFYYFQFCTMQNFQHEYSCVCTFAGGSYTVWNRITECLDIWFSKFENDYIVSSSL
jgi:hypothetical protein